MSSAPAHWIAIDAAFSGWSGYCRMFGTHPVEVHRSKSRDFNNLRWWFEAPAARRAEPTLKRLCSESSQGFMLLDDGPQDVEVGPELVVIEYPYLDKKKSIDTVIKLGRAVGFLEAVADACGAEVVLRRASQWRKHLKVSGSGKAAKDLVRARIRGFATHPDERAPVRGKFNRVYMPGLVGVGLEPADADRAEAAGCGIGYAIERGWPLPTV